LEGHIRSENSGKPNFSERKIRRRRKSIKWGKVEKGGRFNHG